MFRITSPSGREQQINAMPSSGGSNGSVKYVNRPETSSHWQVLQIPERQLKSGFRPCASAKSRRLVYLSSQATVFFEHAKVTVAGLQVTCINGALMCDGWSVCRRQVAGRSLSMSACSPRRNRSAPASSARSRFDVVFADMPLSTASRISRSSSKARRAPAAT